ncbi:MAG TPA: ABC transporter permease subunit [Kofleriaceae bacterium]|jgi:ABC-2 type transport system permease protein|nr:ABC transporter permease subunit [Kofleriaceae bacterium]
MNGARILFARELRAHRRTFLAWAVPVALLLVLFCALQPSFVASGMLEAKLAGLPDSMRKALGLTLVDFHRPPVYLATSFMYVTLPCGLFGALLGANIVAKEELLHTAELLYAQPASRASILVGKAGALAVYVIALPTVLGAVAMITLGAVVDAPLEGALVAQLFLGVAALALCFAGAGMLVAALVRDARAASPIALGLVVGTYFLGVLSALTPAAAPLRFVAPHKLVEPADIVSRGALDPVGALVLAAIGGGFAALAIVRYRRRDLHA